MPCDLGIYTALVSRGIQWKRNVHGLKKGERIGEDTTLKGLKFLKATPKRYQNLVAWVWLTPKRY